MVRINDHPQWPHLFTVAVIQEIKQNISATMAPKELSSQKHQGSISVQK